MATFWEKNKQKSKWAALLLLLRWRKGVVPLLLLVLLIIFLFSAPSTLLAAFVRGLGRIPYGGSRAGAGIAWIASRMGLDGFGSDDHSFNELLAAFRAAKDGKSASLNYLLRGGPAGQTVGQDSIAMVRGDVNNQGGANLGAAVKGGSSVSGILTQEEAKAAGKGVSILPSDLTGERGGLVQSAYGQAGYGQFGGQVTGKRFGAGFSNASELSANGAGAFAPKWFFSASGHAANPDNVRATLGTGTVPIAGQSNTATRRPLGWKGQGNLAQTAASSSRNYGRAGGKALGQLVQARNAGLMSAPGICAPGSCPAEYASSTIGQVYDGDNIAGSTSGGSENTTASIVSAPTQIDGTATPNIPNPGTNIGNPDQIDGGAPPDPTQMTECAKAMKACQDQKNTDMAQIQQIMNTTINPAANAMGGDCGDCCNCGACNNDSTTITTACTNQIKPLYDDIDKPCSMPASCAALQQGSVQGQQTTTTTQDSMQQSGMCTQQMLDQLAGSCASSNFLFGLCVCS